MATAHDARSRRKTTAQQSRESQWTPFAARLREQSARLRADIDRELEKYRAERDGLTTGNVPDRAELSIGDLVADIYLAEVDRDVVELLAVEAALRRIAGQTYGHCSDCGRAIPRRRLEKTPHAARCLPCQALAERQSVRPAKL